MCAFTSLSPVRGHHDRARRPIAIHCCIRFSRGADGRCGTDKVSLQRYYFRGDGIRIRDACVQQYATFQFCFQVVRVVDDRRSIRQLLDGRPQPRMFEHQHVRSTLVHKPAESREAPCIVGQNLAVRQVIELPNILVARHVRRLIQVDDRWLVDAVRLPCRAINRAPDYSEAGCLQRLAGLLRTDLTPIAWSCRRKRDDLQNSGQTGRPTVFSSCNRCRLTVSAV